MAEQHKRMSTKGVGNVTDSSSNKQHDLGVLDAQGVNPRINQDEFAQALEKLVGVKKLQVGCSVGRLVDSMEEPLRSKLQEAILNPAIQSARLTETLSEFGIRLNSDVMRRHRRRMMGRDGCQCPSPNIRPINES